MMHSTPSLEVRESSIRRVVAAAASLLPSVRRRDGRVSTSCPAWGCFLPARSSTSAFIYRRGEIKIPQPKLYTRLGDLLSFFSRAAPCKMFACLLGASKLYFPNTLLDSMHNQPRTSSKVYFFRIAQRYVTPDASICIKDTRAPIHNKRGGYCSCMCAGVPAGILVFGHVFVHT